MRIARAGVMPRRLEASVVNAVVLKGVGGLRVLRFELTSLTTPGLLVPASAASASAFSQNLSVSWWASNAPSGCCEAREHLPVGLRDVRAPLELALDDQRQRRALHAADREEVGAEAAGRERDGAGQRRAPDQVDVLARLAGVGEVVGELVEVGEGALDLLLGQRRVAGALDRRPRRELALGDRGVRVEDLLERLEADQLALAVVVGRDHDRVGVLGHLADRLDDVLVGRLLDQVGVDQLVEVGLLPVRVALGEGRVHDVALEADRHVLAVAVGPGVERDLVGRVGLGLAAAEDLGDLLR